MGLLYARIWPWKRKKNPVRQHQCAAELLEGAGLRTPGILYADDSVSTVSQWGVEVLVEREASGTPLSEIRDTSNPLRLLARDLANLHRVAGQQWHQPWLPSGGSSGPSEWWEDRMSRFRERITPERSDLTTDEVSSALALLRSGLEDAAASEPRLVHGDVSPNHLFLDGERLTWIDLETVHFGAAEEDLALLSRWLKPESLESFLEDYARHRETRIDPERLRTFQLLMHFERLNSRVQQIRRRREKSKRGAKDAKLEADRRDAEQAIRSWLVSQA